MDKTLIETFQNSFTRRDIYEILKYCFSKTERNEMVQKTRWKKNSYDTMRQYFYRGIGEKIPNTTTVQLLSFRSYEEWTLLKQKAKQMSKSEEVDASLLKPLKTDNEIIIELSIPYIQPDIVIINGKRYIPEDESLHLKKEDKEHG